MKKLTQESFDELVVQAQIKPRIRQGLKFVAATAGLDDTDWQDTELLAIPDRTGNKGVLLVAPYEEIRVIAYELSRGLVSRQTGRAQPVICDFCRTWQSGSGAGSISFRKAKQSLNSVTFLCCADLACSRHVRGKTPAARLSRAQLREDMTNDQRVERLKTRLRQILLDI